MTKNLTGTGASQAVALTSADLTTLGDGTINVSDGRSSRSTSHASQEGRKKNKDLFSRIQDILYRYPVSPIINIIDHPVYLTSDLKMLRARNCKLIDALDIIKMTFMRWSIKDFYDNIYSKEDCGLIS